MSGVRVHSYGGTFINFFVINLNVQFVRLTAVNDTSYCEGEIAVAIALTTEGAPERLVGMALEMKSSSAVTFCGTEHGLPQQSVNSTVG